jgi:hypothetical protein
VASEVSELIEAIAHGRDDTSLARLRNSRRKKKFTTEYAEFGVFLIKNSFLRALRASAVSDLLDH